MAKQRDTQAAEEESETQYTSLVDEGPPPESAGSDFSWFELSDLLKLTVPIFFGMISWVAMKTTDTALLGHTGTDYLTASAMSDLWTSSTGVFISGSVLGTFVGQAVGAGNTKMAGVWLQVSYTVLTCVAVPVMISWALTGVLLRNVFDVRPGIANKANYYALVLMACIPARVAYAQLSQYFQAQRIMSPVVTSAACSMLLNLVVGLVLVLGVPIPGFEGYGFVACPIVTCLVEYVQVTGFVLYYCLNKGLHKPGWPGWSWEHVTRARVVEFASMYFPAALSGASDWWRVTVIGVVAAALPGENDLAVFNSSYRILWMCLIFIGALGGATGIKLGMALGAGNGARARMLARLGICCAVVTLFVLAVAVYSMPRQLAHIFSTDPDVIDEFERIRLPLAATMFFMNLSVMLERIPISMGRTRLILMTGVIGSWVGQVPCVFACVYLWKDSLVGLYTGVALGYGLLVTILLFVILTSDFQYYADQAMLRSEVGKVEPDATTNKLHDDEEQGNIQEPTRNQWQPVATDEA